MAYLQTVILSITLSLLSTTTKDIEKSFLQNNPSLLHSLLSSKSHINITFPEPVSFSDQLSSQQTYFFFSRIFSDFTTFEFYPESSLPVPPEKAVFIFKTRWSFRNNKNNNQHVLHVFFLLVNEHHQENQASRFPFRKKRTGFPESWKIQEIRAETL